MIFFSSVQNYKYNTIRKALAKNKSKLMYMLKEHFVRFFSLPINPISQWQLGLDFQK